MEGFTPFDDLIVIERDPPEEVTSFGFVIPACAQEQLDQGTVVAAGPGKRIAGKLRPPLDVKVGDRVLFSKFANLEFMIKGKKYLTMREDDLIGIIENP